MPLPVPRGRVHGDFAQKEFVRGCQATADVACFESNALQLWGVGLAQYSRVVVLDADVLVIREFSALLEHSVHSLLATFDHELDWHSFTTELSNVPVVNSGFWVVAPNCTDFRQMIALLEEGDWDGGGWRRSRVGWGYGGLVQQGILPYHYHKDALAAGEAMVKAPDLPGNMTVSPPSARMKVLDRSVYDVIDTPDLQAAYTSGAASIDDVRVFHFTGGCVKPWMCDAPRTTLCNTMRDRWWEIRAEFAASRGIKPPPRCKAGGKYEALPLAGPLTGRD